MEFAFQQTCGTETQIRGRLNIPQSTLKHRPDSGEVQSNIIPTYTPLPNNNLVTSWGDPVSPTLYQSFIGSINYMALGTRPDLSYAVNYLARVSSNPNETHWTALKHLIQYIATTQNKRLRLQVSNDKLFDWTDTNWGGEFQRSTSGFIIYFLGSPIAWGSRSQRVVATSTCAAEFIALGSSVDFLLFLIPILKSLNCNPPIVFATTGLQYWYPTITL
ncbi:hypothetical protein MJO28_011629 [Puccinia striiformis f. sp. tritici]|uniref:Uncharacterized protein n=1 Tax=Puccinia striiformis f. sp. tritici TaxID=168172 RepID=A0ACC0E3Y9_9BASI|nr:hypothetical protein MJO28_011629 [Puccinia striiformis f. sp. tritici]